MSRSLIQKRHQARFLLIQALYQWQVSENPPADILTQFQLNPQFDKADQTYFTESFLAVINQVTTVDELYQPYLDRALSELDPIEMSILRLATYELSQRLDLPYRVVINEALELAKTFGATDGHKYINGVLDKAAKQLRPSEFK
jgi:N utilization substance protein B